MYHPLLLVLAEACKTQPPQTPFIGACLTPKVFGIRAPKFLAKEVELSTCGRGVCVTVKELGKETILIHDGKSLEFLYSANVLTKRGQRAYEAATIILKDLTTGEGMGINAVLKVFEAYNTIKGLFKEIEDIIDEQEEAEQQGE